MSPSEMNKIRKRLQAVEEKAVNWRKDFIWWWFLA